MNTADEVHWGYSLGGASAGLMWIPDDAANKSLRCPICNTYSDAFITSWTPDPGHLATLAGAARRHRFITTNDGVGVFDQSFLDQLIRGGVDQEGVRRIDRDTFTFELQRLPALASATINDSKLTTCPDCGRATPVFPSNREDFTIVLATRPDEVLVRSFELFGRAYLRHHELYLSDPLFSTLGLLEGYEVVTNSP